MKRLDLELALSHLGQDTDMAIKDICEVMYGLEQFGDMGAAEDFRWLYEDLLRIRKKVDEYFVKMS